MRLPLRAVAPLVALAIALPRLAAAQNPPGGPGGPPAPKNLQVLPKDIPRDSLLGIMRGFTVSLGVRCQYCHVSTPNPNGGPERLDPAADDKVQKQKARFMLRMVDSLNRVVLAALPARHDPPIRVGCVTCHRGLPLPQTLAGTLMAAIDSGGSAGVDSAVARYERLRTDMASGRWDFSEQSLSDLARDVATRGNTAGAITLLLLDQKYYPSSADIDLSLAELYRQRGEKDQAITRYRLALQKRPNDPRIMNRLKELGAAP